MTATTSQPRKVGKQKRVFKKVIRYLQDQALENSNSRTYLSPSGLEPHQRVQSAPHPQRRPKDTSPRRFSEATTAAETCQNARRTEAMAGDGADAGVFREAVPSTAKEMKKVQYAQDNIHQNYKIHIPERDPASIQGDQYWIVFIHGGYFRDPEVDAACFRPALELLTAEDSATDDDSSLATVPESTTSSSPTISTNSLTRDRNDIKKHIAGYVSINYRLAPHPDYPQDEGTENYVKRDAKFPQQLQDVHAALRHLQTKHDVTSNYILAGHSVGATLSFLAALKSTQGQIYPPSCIVGLNGIYDFPYIHKTNPGYDAMTNNTMRPDQYEEASPAFYGVAEYARILPKQQILRILLSHSKDDELVNWDQLVRMHAVLVPESGTTDIDGEGGGQVHVETIETKGKHNQIFEEGRELARTLVRALNMLLAY